MLTPFDDYPVHQTALPLAQVADGHPNFYDRFWFNGYTEDLYFAVAMGLYPNRGVIDAAFSVVHEGKQRSVFASGRIPLDRTRTTIGPISIDIIEPLRVSRIQVDAPEHGLHAELTATARTAAYQEPKSVRYAGSTLIMDVTRATQLMRWTGSLTAGEAEISLDGQRVFGTKDRSWGIRPVGEPAPAAPVPGAHQFFFLWAPLNFDDRCLHYMVFEDETGRPWAQTAVVLPVLPAGGPVHGPDVCVEHVPAVRHELTWAPGLRRCDRATLAIQRSDGTEEPVTLEPLLTFRMKGAGYFHPKWGHGRWHDELAVGGEVHDVAELDVLAPDCVHVQQVMRASWQGRTGLGVLEQLVIGPHQPSGFRDLLDGAR